MLILYGVTTTGLTLECGSDYYLEDFCIIENLEVSNEDEPLQIVFRGDNTRDNTAFLKINIRKSNSGFTTIPAGVFEQLPKLKKFELYRSKMTSLSSDKLAPAKKLESLTLEGCGITEVQPKSFSGFENITDLSLESNHITHIQRDTFVDMPKLKVLELNNNGIRTIEDGAFDLPELVKLQMSGNELTELSDSLFSSLHNLRDLFLFNNELTHIGRSMYGLPRVGQISLYDNQVVDIDLVEFAKMPSLSVLQLDNNGFSLESQTSSDFENEHLETLGLGGVKLVDLKKLSIFKGLRKLNLQSGSYDGLDLPSMNVKSFLPKLEMIILQHPNADCKIVEQLYLTMQEQGITIYFEKYCLFLNCKRFSC